MGRLLFFQVFAAKKLSPMQVHHGNRAARQNTKNEHGDTVLTSK